MFKCPGNENIKDIYVLHWTRSCLQTKQQFETRIISLYHPHYVRGVKSICRQDDVNNNNSSKNDQYYYHGNQPFEHVRYNKLLNDWVFR
jgi:hypothetical protein